MKLYLFVIVLGLVSCSTKEQPEPRFTTQKIQGTWLVERIDLYNNNTNYYSSLPDSSAAINDRLSFYNFKEDNTYSIDTGGLAVIRGRYSIKDTVLTLHNADNTNMDFTFMPETDSTKMILHKDGITVKQKIAYHFIEVMDAKLTNYRWKEPLPNSTTDSAIREKLRIVLTYYNSYFTAIGNSNTKVFNSNRLILPLALYSGGVGMAETKAINPAFITLMGSKENANKAMQMLRAAFQVYFVIPNEKNFLLEYAAVMRHLARQFK